MAKTYRRNSFGRMTWVWYERPWFWQIIALVVVVVGLIIRYVRLALSGLGLEFGGVGLVWRVLTVVWVERGDIARIITAFEPSHYQKRRYSNAK